MHAASWDTFALASAVLPVMLGGIHLYGPGLATG